VAHRGGAATGRQDVAAHAAPAHTRGAPRYRLLPDGQRRRRARPVPPLLPSSLQLLQLPHAPQLGCTRRLYGTELARQHHRPMDHVL
jgi:hypothetical protein